MSEDIYYKIRCDKFHTATLTYTSEMGKVKLSMQTYVRSSGKALLKFNLGARREW